MRARPCDVCKQPYVAKRDNSRYCSDTCRKRAQRSGTPAKGEPVDLGVSVADALEAQLAAAGREASPMGRVALGLAARFDSGRDSGHGLSLLATAIKSAADAALEGAKVEADVVDEVKARRDAIRDRAASG